MIAMGCILILSFQIVAAILIWAGRKNMRFKHEDECIGGLSILIPFHNEENRILELINSLNQLEKKENRAIVFINDHSSDNTVRLIESKLQHPFKIIENTYKKGKKWAIKKGVESANDNWILTWDADVKIGNDYWQRLSELPVADMIVLPVKLTGSKTPSIWAKIEHAFLRFFQDGMASINHPTLASGANLVFRRTAFLELESKRNDYSIPSGDDVFLLGQMRLSNMQILNIPYNQYAVETPAPTNWKSLFQQRKRWSSKVGDMKSWTLIPAGLLLMFVQLSVFGLIWLSLNNPLFILLIGIKIMIEIGIVGTYNKLNVQLILMTIVNQVLYTLIVLVGLFPWGKESKWVITEGQ